MLLHNVGSLASHALQAAQLGKSFCSESLSRAASVHLAYYCACLSLALLPGTRCLSPEVLKQVEEYVAARPDGKLPVSDLAALAHLSPFHFARLFKASTGKTVHEYVLEQRLHRAYDLLLSTDLPLEQIANDLGFADQSHFVRRFKSLFGVTPGAVRRNALP